MQPVADQPSVPGLEHGPGTDADVPQLLEMGGRRDRLGLGAGERLQLHRAADGFLAQAPGTVEVGHEVADHAGQVDRQASCRAARAAGRGSRSSAGARRRPGRCRRHPLRPYGTGCSDKSAGYGGGRTRRSPPVRLAGHCPPVRYPTGRPLGSALSPRLSPDVRRQSSRPIRVAKCPCNAITPGPVSKEKGDADVVEDHVVDGRPAAGRAGRRRGPGPGDVGRRRTVGNLRVRPGATAASPRDSSSAAP